ncbi:MAG: hypothetical protein WHS88_07165 [Anaerohalosphaeraceae bacterium]
MVLENPEQYILQTYAQYSRPDVGQAKYAEFDSSGNLYITHDGRSLVRIGPNGQAEVIARYRNLQGIFYAGEEYDSSLFLMMRIWDGFINDVWMGPQRLFHLFPANRSALP